MRKVLSLVLVLALVLGSFSMAFAAAPADVVGTPNEEAVTVLMGLGVVNGYADGSFKPAGIVTRAEMAKMIVVALGLQDYATGTSKFTDMAGATWAQGYVNYANGLGVILGYPDGTFKPSQTVSYDEAAAMIVRALGYTDASLLPATWPANYVVKAKALGILDGVKASATGASRGDIAEMLYNALTVKMVSVDAENKVTVNDPEDNMLLRLGAELNIDNEGDSAVVYGDEDTLINLVKYVGVYADIYTIDGDVVAVAPISDQLYGAYDDGVFSTADTDYNAASTVADDHVPFFFNGVEEPANSYHAYYSLDSVSAATDSYANVDLSGKKIELVYSMAKWVVNDESYAGLFEDGDADSITDDQQLGGIDFILDDNDNIDLNQFQLFGAASLSDIKVDNVIYVYNGYNEAGVKRIEVGTAKVTGTVTDVSSDEETFTIGGKDYDLAGVSDTEIAIGDTGVALLDYAGDIYDWTVTDTTEGNYAIVIDINEYDDPSAFETQQIKLVTKDGSETIFDVATDVEITLDGVDQGYETDNALWDAYYDEEDLWIEDLITYSVDKDGVIDEINVLDTDSLGETADVNAAGTIVAGKTIASDVVIFTYDNDDNYDVATLNDIKDETLGFADYTYDGGSKIAVLIVDLDDLGGTDSYAVINTTGTALDANGDPVTKVTGFMDGKAFTAKTNHDLYNDSLFTLSFDTYAEGLFVLSFDADGVITDVDFLDNNDESAEDVLATTAGWVDDKDGTTLVNVDGTWVTVSASAAVYELDTVEGEYVLKTLSAIKDGAYVTMWQVDADSDGYDVVVVTTPTPVED